MIDFGPLRRYSHVIYIVLVSLLSLGAILGLIPGVQHLGAFVTPPLCLSLGLTYALACRPAYPSLNKKLSKQLLAYAIIGLGFGMNVEQALASGQEGITFTVASVIGTMLVGLWVARRLFGLDRGVAYLISAGTAICGGSAIAAVAPIVKTEESDTSVALGVVFLLNALGLFIFPYLGRWLGLNQEQFGLWSAIAIHDTSSVVGAASAYGETALGIATTVKLTRALWIIPLALVCSILFKSEGQKVSIPWFILGFIGAMLINTYLLIDYPEFGALLSRVSRQVLSLTMFFIGASLSIETLRSVGYKPLVFALSLWAFISLISLLYILY